MTDEEEAVVERAARAALRCRDSDGDYRGTTADEILQEVAEDVDEWCRLAREVRRRVREIRGEEVREGLPEGRRTESTLEPISSPGSARSRPRDTY